jgi:hypothetical protein
MTLIEICGDSDCFKPPESLSDAIVLAVRLSAIERLVEVPNEFVDEEAESEEDVEDVEMEEEHELDESKLGVTFRLDLAG